MPKGSPGRPRPWSRGKARTTHTVEHAFTLTPRERAVLELSDAGLPRRAIAERLGVQPDSVSYYLKTAREKRRASA